MAKLASRNHIMQHRKKDVNFNPKQGLKKSMSDKERKMRLNIRKKSQVAMWDLNMADIAGIVESNRLMGDILEILLRMLIVTPDENDVYKTAFKGIIYQNDAEIRRILSHIDETRMKSIKDAFKRSKTN